MKYSTNFFFLFCVLFSLNYTIAQTSSSFISDIDGRQNAAQSVMYQKTAGSSLIATDGFSVAAGFPLHGSYTILSPKTGAITANLDADADLEIIYGSAENLYAVNIDGTAVPGFPQTFAAYYEAVWSPSYGDIDGDGEGEIVAGIGGPLGGKIYAFEKDGTPVTNFPITTGKYPFTPILSDLDGDGDLEIITGDRNRKLFVYNGDGTVYPGWPKQLDQYVASSCAAGDINNDGVMDVVAESRNLIFVFDKDGNPHAGFPFAIEDSTTGSNSYSAPVLADLNKDGKLEIIFCSHSDVTGKDGIVYAVDYTGTLLPGWPQYVNNWIYGSPIVHDINNDGSLDVIIGEYYSGSIAGSYIFAYNADGTSLPNFPAGPFFGTANQLTLANIDSDDELEIILDENVYVDGVGGYNALNLDGSTVAGWPLELLLTSSFQQPVLGDFNHDGNLDMIGGSFSYDVNNKETYLYLWNTNLPYDAATIVNPMYQFNPAHDGVYKDPGAIVPVELSVFTGTAGYSSVDLKWTTVTEKNNSGFDVERKDASSSWQKIAFVEGNGTTTDKQDYSFTDRNLFGSKYLYRLKQIDFDGTFEYSKEIEVDINAPKNFVLNQNYPNPFNPATTITFSLPVKSAASLVVYDLLGNEIATLVNKELENGTYTYSFDASRLSSGVYMYKLKTENSILTRKMVVMK